MKDTIAILPFQNVIVDLQERVSPSKMVSPRKKDLACSKEQTFKPATDLVPVRSFQDYFHPPEKLRIHSDLPLLIKAVAGRYIPDPGGPLHPAQDLGTPSEFELSNSQTHSPPNQGGIGSLLRVRGFSALQRSFMRVWDEYRGLRSL